MSIAPVNPEESATGMEEQSEAPQWYDRLLGLLFAILCFEMGIFLLAFPWSGYWSRNFFSWLSPEWRDVWMNAYFRGAVSGLGVVNLYLALLEVFRLQGKRARPEDEG